MSISALGLPAIGRPAFNPWIVAVTVTLATFMEVLDTTIANVSLGHIAGDLGVTRDEASWLLTSYLMANAIVLPISGWISGFIGRKRFYMICVFLFTVSSALCGMAPNLTMLLLFRIFQGVGGGGLQPSEQGILLDTFPREKFGMGMAVYGIAVLVAPILGPTIGGYITEFYNWRWIFYINVPNRLPVAFSDEYRGARSSLHGRARRANRGKRHNLDFIGLGLIALGLGTLEIIYNRGQENDWLNSNFIVGAIILAIVTLVAAVIWGLRHPNPVINLRLLLDRNFAASCLVIYVIFIVLYGSNVLLPMMVQDLFGYDAYTAGLIMFSGGPRGHGLHADHRFPPARRVDARYLIFFGILCVALELTGRHC